MLPEGALSPNNCGEHEEVRTGPPAGREKGLSYVPWVCEQFKLLFAAKKPVLHCRLDLTTVYAT
jgi:hypothetical protein